MTHIEGPFNSEPFDHRQHVKLAWAVLADMPVSEAADFVGSEIRDFASIHAPGKYHETLTQFWVRLVAHTREGGVPGDDFDDHLARFPILMNNNAQKHHYSPEVLVSDRARREFVEPDLLPLP